MISRPSKTAWNLHFLSIPIFVVFEKIIFILVKKLFSTLLTIIYVLQPKIVEFRGRRQRRRERNAAGNRQHDGVRRSIGREQRIFSHVRPRVGVSCRCRSRRYRNGNVAVVSAILTSLLTFFNPRGPLPSRSGPYNLSDFWCYVTCGPHAFSMGLVTRPMWLGTESLKAWRVTYTHRFIIRKARAIFIQYIIYC